MRKCENLLQEERKMQSGNSGINFGKASSLTGRVALFITMSLLISFQANASGIKKNDQSLLIKTDTRGCATEVILASPEDNCSDSEFANNCGKNGKDCVCMRTNKFVTWSVDNGSRFEIQLSGADPFKANCDLKSKNKPQIKCKVAAGNGDYLYDVVLESCPDKTYDPKIIIRN